MSVRRPEASRLQLEAPQSAPGEAQEVPPQGALPVKARAKPWRRRRRFRVGPPDAGVWGRLPFRALIERERSRRARLTLAQRRQLHRQRSLLGIGALIMLFAVVASSLLWFIPITRAALSPSAAKTATASSSPVTSASPDSVRLMVHRNAAQPFTTLRVLAPAGAHAPSVHATAAFLFDPERGVILYQKHADTPYPAASLTKVMTMLLALDSPQLDQLVTVEPDAAALVNGDNSYMNLSVGERVPMRDLLYGLIVMGGNDAALAIADAVGGDQATFVRMMNTRAQQFGLWHTHFVSPDGVDRGDVTSASDMAKLAALAIMRPGAVQFTDAFYKAIPKTATHKAYTLYGSNELLPGGNSPYPGANGVKTGYTASARYCIAFSARVNGHLLVGVLLGEPSDHARLVDARALLNWGFAQA